MDKLLPIGSVVLLKGGKKRVMIYGRKQIRDGEDKVWDYIACLYPEGNLGPDYTYVFDHKSIKKIFFIGFQDYEEIEYKKVIKKSEDQDEEISKNSIDDMDEASLIPNFAEFEGNIEGDGSKPVNEGDGEDLEIDTLISNLVSDSYQDVDENNQKENTAPDNGIDILEDFLKIDINPDDKE